MRQVCAVARGGALGHRLGMWINFARSQLLRPRLVKVASRPLPPAAMPTDARSALDEILCTALVAGTLLVLLVPAARESVAVGWLPMWLVGMPAVAWWAARGFPVPRRDGAQAASVRMPRRARFPEQARRSTRLQRRAAERRVA